MKQLKDVDFQSTFGDVPESFSRRVQYALRRTEEDTRMKKATLRTAVLVTALVLLAATALAAAVVSRTTDFFGSFYGEEKRQQLEGGDAVPGGQSHQVGDIVCTLGDIIAVQEAVTSSLGDGTPFTYDTIALYGTGVIAPAPGANVVLMPMDEYTLSDPWGYDLYYGADEAPEGAVTYEQKAAETGAAIRMVSAIPNYLVGADGEPQYTSTGYTLIPQRDGTVQFSFEIIPDSGATLALQDTYTLSLWLGSDQVAADGSIVEGSRQAEDWVVELRTQPALDTATDMPVASAAPAASIVPSAADVRWADWDQVVRPLCEPAVQATVTDPAGGTAWQLTLAPSSGNGGHADCTPVTDEDAAWMVSALGSTWEPQAVWVTFPDGTTYLGTLASAGYGPEDAWLDEDTGEMVEHASAKHICIHFPRATDGMDPTSYAIRHQHALSACWQALQAP
ncbi:MAG: hypothetical protein ACI4MK_15615 [Aristaeellaceae bacterium]